MLPLENRNFRDAQNWLEWKSRWALKSSTLISLAYRRFLLNEMPIISIVWHITIMAWAGTLDNPEWPFKRHLELESKHITVHTVWEYLL